MKVVEFRHQRTSEEIGGDYSNEKPRPITLSLDARKNRDGGSSCLILNTENTEVYNGSWVHVWLKDLGIKIDFDRNASVNWGDEAVAREQVLLTLKKKMTPQILLKSLELAVTYGMNKGKEDSQYEIRKALGIGRY